MARSTDDAQRFLERAHEVLDAHGVEATLARQPLAAASHFIVRSGLASMTCYATGKIALGGPIDDCDHLCEPLSRAGLLQGWQPGARGGATWHSEPVIDFASASAKVQEPPAYTRDQRVTETHTWLIRVASAGERGSAELDELGRAMYLDTTSGGWKEAARTLAERLVDAGFDPFDRSPAGPRAARALGYDKPPAGGELAILGARGWLVFTLAPAADDKPPRLALRLGPGVDDPVQLLQELLAGFDLTPSQVDALRRMGAPSPLR